MLACVSGLNSGPRSLIKQSCQRHCDGSHGNIGHINVWLRNKTRMRPLIHIALHFIVPALVAGKFYYGRWKWAFLVMVGTMLIDIDHLLADPVFDPNRCGIGFHPLHSYPALVVYLVLLAIPKVRLVALGLAIHIALDGVDCVWMKLE